MEEYSALRGIPFDPVELERLIESLCEPRVEEVNSLEPQTRSGRVRHSPKMKKLLPRIEQHYSRIAPNIRELRWQKEAGSAAAAAELLFALRCLRKFEAKSGAYFPPELNEYADKEDLSAEGVIEVVACRTGPSQDDVEDSTGAGSRQGEAIDIETFIFDCLIVSEMKPIPKNLEKSQAAMSDVPEDLAARQRQMAISALLSQLETALGLTGSSDPNSSPETRLEVVLSRFRQQQAEATSSALTAQHAKQEVAAAQARQAAAEQHHMAIQQQYAAGMAALERTAREQVQGVRSEAEEVLAGLRRASTVLQDPPPEDSMPSWALKFGMRKGKFWCWSCNSGHRKNLK